MFSLFTFSNNLQALTYDVFLHTDKIGIIDLTSGEFIDKKHDPRDNSMPYLELYRDQINTALELIHAISSCFNNKQYSYYGSLREGSENTTLTFPPPFQNLTYSIKDRLVTTIVEGLSLDMMILHPSMEECSGIFFHLILGFNSILMERGVPIAISAIASEEKQPITPAMRAIPPKAITIIHEKLEGAFIHTQSITQQVKIEIIHKMRKLLSQHHSMNPAPQNSPKEEQTKPPLQFNELQQRLEQISLTQQENSGEDRVFKSQGRTRHYSEPCTKRKKFYSDSPKQSPNLSKKRHHSASGYDEK
ncbi:hypothetical protein [Endozoicomonas sp. Mp262]|uniref:hypothetical protein n=1 Tax=Endozoicomonas sp. Mp262 TaxID=2919499 RepID=UPI0021DB68AD